MKVWKRLHKITSLAVIGMMLAAGPCQTVFAEETSVEAAAEAEAQAAAEAAAKAAAEAEAKAAAEAAAKAVAEAEAKAAAEAAAREAEAKAAAEEAARAAEAEAAARAAETEAAQEETISSDPVQSEDTGAADTETEGEPAAENTEKASAQEDPFTGTVRVEMAQQGPVCMGSQVTLKAVAENTNKTFSIRWESRKDAQSAWNTVGEGTEYSFIVNEENAQYEYRAVLVAA